MHIVGIVVFFAVVIFIKLKMPVWKGKYSEKLVNNKIQELPEEYVVFNDLLFESNGYSTQIDHIVVSPYGVFVIETKGYKGWILGRENGEYWTQTIYKSKHQFYNPIKQNAGHVRFLHHLLKCSTDILFIPIVVFNNSAELKVHADNNIVVNRYNLKRAILQYRTAVLWFLNGNGILYNEDGSKRIADNTLVALTLMIAESRTEEKDTMVKVIVNLNQQEQLMSLLASSFLVGNFSFRWFIYM